SVRRTGIGHDMFFESRSQGVPQLRQDFRLRVDNPPDLRELALVESEYQNDEDHGGYLRHARLPSDPLFGRDVPDPLRTGEPPELSNKHCKGAPAVGYRDGL